MRCTVLICDSVLARWADILYLGAAAGAPCMSRVFNCWDGCGTLGVNRRVESDYSSLLWSALGVD
jgi:hypothetical protein